MKLILHLILCLSLFSNNVSSAETIKISVGEWPPYITESEADKGIIATLIKDIFKDEGYQVEIDFFPWQRAYNLAESGIYQATAIWMPTTDRLKDFYFSDPVLDESFFFFHLKDFEFDWNSLDDITDLNMGLNLGYSYGEKMDAYINASKLNIVSAVSSPIQSYGMLLKKRIQIYPSEVQVGYFNINKIYPPEIAEKFTHHPKPIIINKSHLLFSKKSPNNVHLLKLFNKRLQEYKASGKYDSYFKI